MKGPYVSSISSLLERITHAHRHGLKYRKELIQKLVNFQNIYLKKEKKKNV